MDPLSIAWIAIFAMLIVIAMGIPVAIAMLSVSAVGMYFAAGEIYTLQTLRTLPYSTASSYAFAAVPMFVTMGIIAGSSGIVSDVYKAANMWLARLRGGLYMATTCTSAAFGAVNGSTIVGAALFTRIALPEMIRLGYSRAAGAGCIAAAGTFAAMIPPSITMVLYGIITNESIGQILIAGILPGVLTAVVYLIGIGVLVRLRPRWAPPPQESFSLNERLRSLTTVWPVAVLAFLVIGGIYSGFVSPSAAGAVGAFGALLIGLGLRRLAGRTLIEGMWEAAAITTVLFLIVIGGLAFSRMLLVTGFVNDLLSMINTLGLEPWVLIIALVVVYLLLGMLMDPISMMVMTAPIVHPLVVGLGYDPIWFAIIMVKLIELSCMTPPVGLNLFAVASASKGLVSIKDVYIGVTPFVFLEIVVLIILLAVPEIVLYLPKAMIR